MKSLIPLEAQAGMTASEIIFAEGVAAMLEATGFDGRSVALALLAAQPKERSHDLGCSRAAFAGTATQVGCSCLGRSRARCFSCSPLCCGGCVGASILADGASTSSEGSA